MKRKQKKVLGRQRPTLAELGRWIAGKHEAEAELLAAKDRLTNEQNLRGQTKMFLESEQKARADVQMRLGMVMDDLERANKREASVIAERDRIIRIVDQFLTVSIMPTASVPPLVTGADMNLPSKLRLPTKQS